MKLTDNSAEQALLERLIEDSKPPIPSECRHLDFLLFTPFRYTPYPQGSRFRRAGLTPGVFYASETPDTAIAEVCFYRLLFFSESPDTPWPGNAGEYTAFACDYATSRAIDLTRPPFDNRHASWTHPIDYTACQGIADLARAADVDAIRYESVRDPSHRANIALLTCTAFASPEPVARLTWRILLIDTGARAHCEMPRQSLDFDRAAFAGDSRISSMRWDR
jgi:hypothetical protein